MFFCFYWSTVHSHEYVYLYINLVSNTNVKVYWWHLIIVSFYVITKKRHQTKMFSLYLIFKSSAECEESVSPSQIGIDNLAHEKYVFRALLKDHQHERMIELQLWDKSERQKFDADPSGGSSGGSNLINIQSSLVHNLTDQWSRVSWRWTT